MVTKGENVAISVYDCSSPACDYTPEETSPVFSLAFVTRGTFTVRSESGVHQADPHHYVLFAADRPYQVAHPQEGGDVCSVFEFSSPLIREALHAFDRDPERQQIQSGLTTSRQFFVHRQLLAAADKATDLEGFESAIQLLEEVLAPVPAKPTKIARELAEETRRALFQDFRQDDTLEELAFQLGYSPFHLARSFRKVFGTSIHQYKTELRLRASLDILGRSRRDVGEIGLELGFASPSHFAYAFRRAYGVTPSEFRESVKCESVKC